MTARSRPRHRWRWPTCCAWLRCCRGSRQGRARQAAQADGIEINAIAIEDMGNSAPISAFYKRWAITKGGFVMTARGLGDYPRAIREKLLRELTKPGS